MIDGVKVIANFICEPEELKPYVEYVKAHADNVIDINLYKIHNDLIQLEYLAHGEPLPNLFSVTGHFFTERGIGKSTKY